VLAQTRKVLLLRIFVDPQYAFPNGSCLAAFADTKGAVTRSVCCAEAAVRICLRKDKVDRARIRWRGGGKPYAGFQPRPMLRFAAAALVARMATSFARIAFDKARGIGI
jgi:hypothetical protein